jgi:hypothetical protein
MGWMYQSVSKPFTVAGLHRALAEFLASAPELRDHEVWLTEGSRLVRMEEEQGGRRVFLAGLGVIREVVPSRYATDGDTDKRVTSSRKGRECYWCQQGVGHIHEREATEPCLSDG